MLAYFRRCIYELAERLPMSKEAAEAAVSTQCDFANGAPELITDGPSANGQRSGRSRSQHAVRLCEWRSSPYRSIMLIDSIPTLPPLTTSMLLNSSFINLTTASFLVAVWTNSTSTLSLP